MDRPQQPEIERSGRGDVDPEGRSAAARAKSTPDERGGGKVPDENLPPHEREQPPHSDTERT